MGLLPAFQGGFHGLGAGHVKLQQFSLPFDGRKAILGRRIVGNVIDENVIAPPVKLFTDGAAYSTAAAGYQGNFHFTMALKVFIALTQVPSTPWRPMFWPVRKSQGMGVWGGRKSADVCFTMPKAVPPGVPV